MIIIQWFEKNMLNFVLTYNKNNFSYGSLKLLKIDKEQSLKLVLVWNSKSESS